MSQRRPSSSRRGHRVLVASGLTAALVTVPGMAAANDEVSPAKPAIDFLMSGANGQLDPAALLAVPTIAIPQEVRDAFQQLADAAMLPEGCVDGVADAIELILNGVIALPLELADALAGLLELLAGGLPEGFPEIPGLADFLDLLEGLGGGSPLPIEDDATDTTSTQTNSDTSTETSADTSTETSADTSTETSADTSTEKGTDTGTAAAVTEEEVLAEGQAELPTVVQGLVALGAALQACIPAPPAEEPEPEPENPTVVQPLPEQPAPPAAAPVAQPVAYLGYAPTGADSARADDTWVPLSALGGGLVLVAAGAAGYGMRSRAVRTRD